jgi:hypothetical protein
MAFLIVPILRILVFAASLYVAWSTVHDPAWGWKTGQGLIGGVTKGLLFLSLAALFYISTLSILSTPGPILTALVSDQARFPSVTTLLVLPAVINLLWLAVAAFLAWLLASRPDWSAVVSFTSWRPTGLQKLFLYLTAAFLLAEILGFGQDIVMDLLGVGALNRVFSDEPELQGLMIGANILYGLAVVAFLWFAPQHMPPAPSSATDRKEEA